MIFYFAILFATVAFSLVYCQSKNENWTLVINKKNILIKRITALLIPVPMVFLATFRSKQIGVDSRAYWDMFVEGWFTKHEPGYSLLNALLKLIWPNPIFMYFVVSAIILGIIIYTCIKQSKDICMSVFLFMCMGFFFFSINIQRQYIALAICFFSYQFISYDKKDIKKYLISILIASTFHISALIMIPFYFVLRRDYKLKHWSILYILSIFLCFFRLPIIQLIKWFFNIINYNYTEHELYGLFKIDLSPIWIAIWGALLFLYVLLYKKSCPKDKYNIVWENIIIINFFFYTTFSVVVGGFFNNRISQYFSIMVILIIPEVIYALCPKKCYKTTKLAVYIIFLLWFIRQLVLDNKTSHFLVPYRSTLNLNFDIIGLVILVISSVYIIYYNIKYLKSQEVHQIQSQNANAVENDYYSYLSKTDHLVSIVVPIYKVKKYLSKCVDSIIAQDYKNLEIILVDDGSPDNCPEICDEYAKKDERIRVVHKENGGLSDARNAGIKVATGEYIAFIDSDDYVAENYISMLLYTLKKYDADISACNYIKVYEDTGRQEVEPKTDKELVMTNVEAMKDLFILPSNSDVVTWNKLYRTSLFTDNNIEFPKGKLHEDNFTTYKLYYYSSKVAFVNVPCYYYLQRKDSIMGQKFNPRRLDVLLALQEIKKFVKKNNIDLEQEIKFNELLILLVLLNSMIDTNCVDDKVFEDISNRIIKDKCEYLNNPYLRTKNKLAIYSLQAGKSAYTLVRKLFVLKNKLK